MRHIIEVGNKSPKTAELHHHSAWSKDARKRGRSPEVLVEIAATFSKLDALAITDHDDVFPSLIARDWAARRGYLDRLQIVTGAEISSQAGHVLALFIEKNISPGLSLIDTIRLIHSQNGLAIAPHPLYERLQESSLGKNNLLQVAYHPDSDIYWDGYEVFSGGAQDFNRGFPNEQALKLFLQHPGKFGAAIGSTDGHGSLMGRGLTTYNGDLKRSLQDRKAGVAFSTNQDVQDYLDSLGDTLGGSFKQQSAAMRNRVLRHHQSRLASETKLIGVKAIAGTKPDTAFLSEEELSRFNQLRDDRKLSWASSRLALKLAYCAVTGLDLEFLPVLNVKNEIKGGNSGTRSGPPYISINPDLNYSLSHTDNAGIGGVSLYPIGIDAEKIGSKRAKQGIGQLTVEEIMRREKLLHYIASEAEIEQETGLEQDDKIAKIWTLKEAVIKGTQYGVSLKELPVLLEKRTDDLYKAEAWFRGEPHSVWSGRSFKDQNWYLAVALQHGEIAQTEIDWYQLPTLD